MRTETIELGGQSYELSELPLRANAQWRQRLDLALSEYSELLGRSTSINLSDTANVIAVVREASNLIIHAPDMVIDLFFAYAVNLEPKRDKILDKAYESELMDAFGAVLKLAFPFGGLARWISTLADNGSDQKHSAPTLTNSSQPSIPTKPG